MCTTEQNIKFAAIRFEYHIFTCVFYFKKVRKEGKRKHDYFFIFEYYAQVSYILFSAFLSQGDPG